ncbi:purple acid phosphatase family protein [Sphingobacterium zhuxiongii]|uniref:Purple acid phosphatase n=1 Tax=Sphingobacterium zhuxiongii TaxID=2662364 RepID=A0A5Q0QBA5_9SPHI|nr:FN3 domain-containing metallophosphoesterase family protein [Sphingobacterium sp. dk4302]QGA26833.1 purple acid phosphatase [Sphingobacterium sp. dk4302]
MKSKTLFIALFLTIFSLNVFSQDKITISHQPYIQALTDSSLSIVWVTNKPAVAWVEIAPDDQSHFYAKERPKLYAAKYGYKTVGTVHQVDLKDLKPGTKYRYRVYNQEVLKHQGTRVQYGNFVATDVYSKEALTFTTPKPSDKVSFAILNDIHGKNDVLTNLIGQADMAKTDFVVFNGDMVDALISEDQMFNGFMDTAIKLFASEKPMYYSRGNHETRGPFAVAYPQYFPTSSGELYYMFTQGEACFIVLDGGEDKPDTDIEYSGIVDMDFYRVQQAEWLAKAVESPAYKNARYKIVICHMPPMGGWHGMIDIERQFVPILNKAGAQIMISGHLHKHVKQMPTAGVNFPILVNSNVNLVKAEITPQKAVFKVVDQQGKQVDEISLNPLR